MPMWGLITIFMEFVGQAYVRHAGGSVGRSTIINTRQRMYYTMLSPKFSYNLKYNFIVLPCLGTILGYTYHHHTAIGRVINYSPTVLAWPALPPLHFVKVIAWFCPTLNVNNLAVIIEVLMMMVADDDQDAPPVTPRSVSSDRVRGVPRFAPTYQLSSWW